MTSFRKKKYFFFFFLDLAPKFGDFAIKMTSFGQTYSKIFQTYIKINADKKGIFILKECGFSVLFLKKKFQSVSLTNKQWRICVSSLISFKQREIIMQLNTRSLFIKKNLFVKSKILYLPLFLFYKLNLFLKFNYRKICLFLHFFLSNYNLNMILLSPSNKKCFFLFSFN